MIIRTPRSLLHFLIDSVLTALAWFAFLYLLANGVVSIVKGDRQGTEEISTLRHLLPSLGTLLVYFLVAVCIALVLYAWAKYNAKRFGGLDRRASPPALSREDLAASFGISVEQLDQLRRSYVSVIHHAPDGHIVGIETRVS
ncbi:MAG: poly-beta-1,6-N-acetyl-D-glucosamine biosynthesis protein PgaD [Bordetella sp.]|uniref:poly-beta-1,6-N-acetyl-D-glucosamine biosynthesis protein PgaD n=1 Tax=Bordetella sp. TaxID=28081 RepID=UPI003F7C347A